MYETVDKQHGRHEIRRIQFSTLLNDYVQFPYCGQVFRLERQRIILKTGKTQRECVYGITSLTPAQAGAPRLLELNRGHWSIENRSHYVRDMAFDEDRSQIRAKQGPQVMATLRNFAISVLRLLGVKNIASALRAYARSTRRALHLLGI